MRADEERMESGCSRIDRLPIGQVESSIVPSGLRFIEQEESGG